MKDAVVEQLCAADFIIETCPGISESIPLACSAKEERSLLIPPHYVIHLNTQTGIWNSFPFPNRVISLDFTRTGSGILVFS